MGGGILVDGGDGGAVHLGGREPALIALFRGALRPGSAEEIVVATAKGSGELPVEEERYIGLDGTRPDAVSFSVVSSPVWVNGS